MATMPMTPAAEAMPAEAMPAEALPAEEMPAEEAGGYVIEIMVHTDGTFEVALGEMKMEAGEPAGESFTDLGAALKAVMMMVKENPMGSSAQGQFDAGFKAKY